MDQKLKTTLGQWRIKADNDIKAAENGLDAKEPITDAVCFHAQQAAEKYLKMFLISKDKEPVKTHNIKYLLDECAVLCADFQKLSGIEYLTEYAVTLRYPDDFYIPTIDEAKNALIDAKRVKEFVLEAMSK